MENAKLNINKTKYRYLMDNICSNGTAITYTVPIDKNPPSNDGELNRKYPFVKISYKKLVSMIDKTAKSLIAIGVKENDIVTICSSSTPETIYIDYALNKIGAIPNYIYPNITAEEMEFYFNEVNCKYVFMLNQPEIRKNVAEILCKTSVKTIISATAIESFSFIFRKIAEKKSGGEAISISCEIKWQDFLRLGNSINNVIEKEYAANSICSLVHTSGTSSVPKAVMDTNENLNAVVRNYFVEELYVDYKKGALSTIPGFVEFGKLLVHMVLSFGGNLILIPEYNPKNLVDLVIKFRPITFETTPIHARELIKSTKITDLSFLEMACFGGDDFESVESAVTDYIRNKNSIASIVNGYGSTEVTSAAISNTIKKHKKGAIGIPVGYTEVALFEQGTFQKISTPNTIGELAIAGDTVTLGYYNDEERTKEVYVKHDDGKIWVHMGDCAYYDEDGFFYYKGRIKNIIVRNALKISPDEVVKTIESHQNVKQCIVIPRYSKEEGETPSAHIVLNDYSDCDKTLEEIKQLVNDNVQEFHRPTHYKIRTAIPLTKNNKNNITALKIEDTATMFGGVISADIEAHNTSEYEFLLKVKIQSDKSDAETIEALEKHINKIANIIKFNVGMIKYEIEKV